MKSKENGGKQILSYTISVTEESWEGKFCLASARAFKIGKPNLETGKCMRSG
jgi:hypothetical protein